MASVGAHPSDVETLVSLEKIKRHLASSSGRNLLQGPLLKRSETLRKWNERWVILDPTTGKMEYKVRRNEPSAKGTIIFDANSTITISPVNFHGLPKYDGCCLYVGTPQKKDYFLCAETPAAARAWVSTLQATQLVLKAHKEAVNSLSGNGSSTLGTVATVVAAANSTALEASKEIEAAMQVTMRNALGALTSRHIDGPMDDLTVMKETLRVKDEELQHLARDIRARDSTIREIAEKLSETAEAAEAAASAARVMDEQRKIACAEIERLSKNSEKNFESYMKKMKESEERIIGISKERDELVKQRELANEEAHLWRSELAKSRERVVILEASVVRAEEKVRVTMADAECIVKEAALREATALKEKQDLLAYIKVLQEQLKREEVDDAEKMDSKTKHINPPCEEENVDKACLISVSSSSRAVPVHVDNEAASTTTMVTEEWNDIEANENEEERRGGSLLDIPVVSQPVNGHHDHQLHSQP